MAAWAGAIDVPSSEAASSKEPVFLNKRDVRISISCEKWEMHSLSLDKSPRCDAGLYPEQRMAHGTQLGASCRHIGTQGCDLRPEARRVVEVDEVGELVGGDIIDEGKRRLHQPPVEADMAAPGAAAPLGLGIGKRKAAGCAPQFTGDARQSPGQQAFGAGEQPGADQRTRIAPRRSINTQDAAVALHPTEQGCVDVEPECAPKIVHLADRRRIRLRCARLQAGPGAMQPVVLL